MAFFYSNPLDIDAMISSFKAILSSVPQLGGTVKAREGASIPLLYHPSPVSLDFQIQDLSQDTSIVVSKEDIGCRTQTSPFCAEIETSGPFTFGTPLAIFRFTKLRGDVWALGATVQHVIADGAAFYNLLRNWACETRGAEWPKFQDQSASNSFVFPTEITRPEERGPVPFSFTNNCRKIFRFGPDAIKKLKSVAMSGIQNNSEHQNSGIKFLSTTDVVFTQLGRIIAKAAANSDNPPPDTFYLLVPSNYRTAHDPPIPEYFGNCTGGVVGEWTREQLINQDYPSLVKKFHLDIRRPRDPVGIKTGGLTVLITTLAGYPYFSENLDFGTGNFPGIGNILTVLPTPEGGVEVLATLPDFVEKSLGDFEYDFVDEHLVF